MLIKGFEFIRCLFLCAELTSNFKKSMLRKILIISLLVIGSIPNIYSINSDHKADFLLNNQFAINNISDDSLNGGRSRDGRTGVEINPINGQNNNGTNGNNPNNRWYNQGTHTDSLIRLDTVKPIDSTRSLHNENMLEEKPVNMTENLDRENNFLNSLVYDKPKNNLLQKVLRKNYRVT